MKDNYLRNPFIILNILSYSCDGFNQPLSKVWCNPAVELLWLMSEPACHSHLEVIVFNRDENMI